MYVPDDHMLQIASNVFKFDIITSTRAYKQRLHDAIQKDMVRDLTDESLSDLSDEEIKVLPPLRYINVAQKSPTWLKLRSAADGTASSVGKYIKSCCRFPSLDQILEDWRAKMSHAPFVKTHTMLGHMNWGVGYEDPALVHFSTDHDVGVIQSGTLKVDLKYILKLGKSVHGDTWVNPDFVITTQHLLVSPDGLVGVPEHTDLKKMSSEPYKRLLGMLEIKCISPFHHVEDSQNYLQWVNDMNTRQWRYPEEIPFVYVTQMGLQAISGVQHLQMKSSSTMWFVRWSPLGYSVFTFSFKHLIRFGTLAATLYFSMLERTRTVEDVEKLYPLNHIETIIENSMNVAYKELLKHSTYKFIEIQDYPEFDVYQDVTKYFKFIVQDPDEIKARVDTSKQLQTISAHDTLDKCFC